MRIDAYNQVSQVYGVNRKTKTSATTKTTRSDKVEISNLGKDLQIAKQAIKDTPDVREDVVAKFKTQINNGTYDVDGESFADKLMEKLGLL
ncbi:MAG: flagellar biosynthesis anti-sigma factor FlgM [Lachnospiraceae bacterium]|nr:flagellar biosynthesis anti-sigma factor FlgM [Lachnospiraceae bacterium]MDE6698404.1 flagellar biosynthesis anti-sigma factor FlgM [Lachnospiraceae bacterium]